MITDSNKGGTADAGEAARGAKVSKISTAERDVPTPKATEAPIAPVVIEETHKDNVSPQTAPPVDGEALKPIIAPLPGDEDLAKEEPAQENAVAPAPEKPEGHVLVTVASTYRWNVIQAAGMPLSKGEWTPVSKDSPLLAELKANPYVEVKE